MSSGRFIIEHGVKRELSLAEASARDAQVQAEWDAGLVDRLEAKCRAATAERDRRIAVGFSYAIPPTPPAGSNPIHIYQIDNARILQIMSVQMLTVVMGIHDSHNGSWLDVDNVAVAMDFHQWNAFAIAATAYRVGLIRSAHTLKATVRAIAADPQYATVAERDAALVAIDVTDDAHWA